MQEYWEGSKQLPKAWKDQLHAIDERLKDFGYSLYELYRAGVHNSNKANAFQRWEIIQ
jgi:hypothetical protein